MPPLATRTCRHLRELVLAIAVYALLTAAFVILASWPLVGLGPASIVLAVFAALYGPAAGALAAFLGALAAGFFLHGGFLAILVSSAPGGLIGFYALGYAYRRLGGDPVSRYAVSTVLGLGLSIAVSSAGLHVFSSLVPGGWWAPWSKASFASLGAFYEVLSEAPIAVLVGAPIVSRVERRREEKRREEQVIVWRPG